VIELATIFCRGHLCIYDRRSAATIGNRRCAGLNALNVSMHQCIKARDSWSCYGSDWVLSGVCVCVVDRRIPQSSPKAHGEPLETIQRVNELKQSVRQFAFRILVGKRHKQALGNWLTPQTVMP
jgi:hypothetical protein